MGAIAIPLSFGHGKKEVFDVVNVNEEARIILKPCGESLEMTASALENITRFIIRYVYGNKQSNSATMARMKKFL